jgi:hypothetical protein
MPTSKEYLAMTDEQLMDLAATALAGSAASNLAISILSMRTAIKNAQATDNLVKYTKHLATATWGIAAITLITQVALIYLTVHAGK